jgi:hypothetical protein
MDFVTDLALSVLFALLKRPKIDAKLVPALAKPFIALRTAADMNPTLAAEIQRRDGK